MDQEKRAFEIIQTLCEKGCKAYITGGAVRDLFLGRTPKDYDVVTEATIEQLHELFSDCETNTFGKSFEVTMIDGIDVAGYRIDVHNENGDLVDVVPAMTIEEDLGRRDLTFNALAFCPYTHELIDPYNGKQDLENRIIRFTGDAHRRIVEDPCRIIRACRFLARLEGVFADSTFEALKSHAFLVSRVKPERLHKELMSVLQYNKPSIFFKALYDIGALKYLFPSMVKCFDVQGGKYHTETVFEHLMLCGDALSPKYPVLRLTGYLHDVGKAESITTGSDGAVHFIDHEDVGADILEVELKALKFSTNDINYIVNLTRQHMKPVLKVKSKKSFRKLLRVFTEKNVNWKDFIKLRIADRTANLAKEPHSRAEIKQMVMSLYNVINEPAAAFSLKDLAINGHDIMQVTGASPGPIIKVVLNYLFEAVLENPELNTREELLELTQSYRPCGCVR